MAKKHYKQVTDDDFKTAKLLQEAGLRPNKAARVLNRSANTVGMLYRASSFKDYKESVTAYNEDRKKSTVAESVQATLMEVEPPSPQLDLREYVAVLDNINESLQSIDTRLKWLEDNCPVPAKRKFF